MFPPVPMIARHATERTEIEGSVIPVGTIVGVDIFEMHRDSDYFQDAERFNPDRFEAVRETGKSNPFTYIPFSAGSRNCIGRRFSLATFGLIEINSTYFLRSKVRPIRNQDGRNEDPSELHAGTTLPEL